MPNNSDSIINRYKKYITDLQRKKLRSMYPGYRQTTADEMRDAYLQTRKAMGGVNERASAYGLGQGYVNRKMMGYNSTLSDYGRQMQEASDELFERQVVNSANETIKAINEAEREKARKKAAAAAKARAKAAADAQKKYEEELKKYNEQLKKYNAYVKQQKASKNALRSGGAAKSINAANAYEARDAAQGEFYDPRFGRAGVYGSSWNVYSTGKKTPRQAWNEYFDPRFADPLTGKQKPKINQGLTNYNATPKQVQKQKQKQKSYGSATQPEFSINPKVKPPVAPQQEKIIEEQVAEITPEQIPELTQQYLRDVNRFMLTQEKVGNSLGSLYELNDMKNNFAAAVEAARDTRLSPQERRMYANEAKLIQRDYNKMRTTVNVNDASVYTQQLTPMYDALQVQRGVLQRLGVEMSDNDIAFNRNWLANGNEMPTISEANYTMARGLMDQTPASQATGKKIDKEGHGEFWDHIKRVKVEDSGERYASGFIKYKYGFSPEDEKWLRDNGYGWIIDNPRLQYTSNAMGSPESQYVDAVSEYLEGVVGKGEGYHRALNNSRALNEVRSIPDNQLKALVTQGESKSHLTDILAEPGKYANTQVVSPGTGPNVTNPEKYLEDAAYEISKNTGIKYGIIDNPDVIRALQQDKATVAFINYCIAKGDIETANEYLYEYAEIVNAAKGQDIANAIQNAQIWGGFKEIAEHFVQLGYGVSTFFTGLEDLFASYKEPTRAGEYMSSQITQNKVSRGWNPFWAKAIDSATVSTGRQLPSIALSFAGGAIGEAVGGLTGTIASHAGTIAMGVSSAGTAKMEALREGYGTDAATAYGILNGISETVLQEAIGGIVGLGGHGAFTKALEKTVNSIKSPAGRVVATQALDALSEITQEEFGDIFENINRSVTLGEKRGLFDGVADQAGETAISTAISTLLLNALHIPSQLRTERGYSAIAKAANMSVSDAKFLLDTEAAIKGGENVNPKDLERYNELTAVLTAAMPNDIVKAIEDGKMTVSDWVTSTEGVVQGKLTGKLTREERTATQTEAIDHTEALKGKTEEQQRDYLLTATPTGKVGNAYYTTTNGKAIEFRNLNNTQKANYILAQKCAKAFEGSVDIVIHDTLPVSNGAMVGSDGKLHIAIDTTNEQGRESIAYWTLAHEAGHALKIADSKAWNEMYGILTDYAKNYKDRDGKILYDALVDSITNQYKYDNDSDAFNDEMFSLIAERMVGSEGEQWAATLGDNTIFDAIAKDKNASAKAKKGFLGKLKTSVEKLSRQFRDGGFSKERKRLAKIREQLTEAYKRINEGDSVREKYAEQSAQRRKETPATTRKVEVREGENLVAEKGIIGKSGTVRYGAGNKLTLKFHYAAVNVNDLITSHTLDGSINDAYPSELQPRDRSRASSQQQILDIGNDIIPEKLGAYPGVQEGAPIIGKDMIVESGNGRTIALRYAANNGKLKGYTAWLKEHASEYGLKAEDIKPDTVLVRVRDSEVNRADFAKEANKTTIATMNATERAQTDADALESILNKYHFTEGADFNSSANSEFFSAFVNKVAGVNEAGSLLTANGTLSNEGITRIQNALFELAYHDKTLTEQFTEGDENPLRNIIKALLNVAPVVAKTTAEIANGDLYAVDFADDFVAAEKFLKDLKNNPDMDGLRKAEAYYEAYPSNLVEETPDYLKQLEIAIDNNIRSQRSLSYLLNRIIEGVQRLGSPNQLDMFGGMVDTSTAEAVNELKERIVDRAVDALEKQKEEWANSTRFQNRATDAEYLSLAEKYRDGTATDAEKAELEKRVEEAARKAGYDSPKLYHGTQRFGFTKFNPIMSDDGRSLFFTSSDRVASTYSNKPGEQQLSSPRMQWQDIKELAPDSLVWALNEYARLLADYDETQRKYKYYTPEDVKQLAKDVDIQIDELKSSVSSLIDEYADKLAVDFDERVADIHRDLVRLEKAIEKKDLSDVSSLVWRIAFKYRAENVLDSTDGEELVHAIGLYNKLKYESGGKPVIVKSELGGYSTQLMRTVDAKNELYDMVKSGNYGVYADTGSALAIDADNSTWDDIPFETDDGYTYSTTREIAEYADNNGYDSVIFKNLVDTGGKGPELDAYNETSDVYVLFSGSRIKSANPVTYDDNGDIIPLSERFNAENEDIRYSLRKTDAEYMKAVEDGDEATQARIIEEAAKKAGYTRKVYRGGGQAHNVFDTTRGAGDTQYGAGTYFTDGFGLAKDWAAERAHGDDEGYVGQYYIQEDDFFDDRSVDTNSSRWKKVEDILRGYGVTERYINVAADHGFAGIARALQTVGKIDEGNFAIYNWENATLVNQILRDAGYKGIVGDFYDMTQWVVFSPSQIKSADLITRDDDGNIIPPSKRFDINNEDIRYQQRDFRIDFNVPQLDTKALHEAVKGGEGTVENRFEVKYEKTDSGFAVHITDKDSGKTYDRAETVTEGNAKAEAERAAAAVIRNIKRGKPDSTSRSTAGIYIEKGEIPKRDINVPISVKEGMKTSQLARTIAEAVESDEFAEKLLTEVYDGLMSYTPDVNKTSMDKALGKLKDNMSAAVTEWNAAVNKNRVLTPDEVALGAALLHSAAESGNFNEAMEIASQLQDQATKGGKLVQSFRMIKRLGAAGALYYVNRQMSKINAELEAAAKGYKLKLNPDLVQRLLNAKDYHEIREAVEAIRKDLGEQLHPTLRDWLTAWRYTAMLGNFRTLIRNDIGNMGFMPIVAVKNVLNNAIQGGVQLVSGGRFQKTTKLFASKAYRDFAAWDWNDSTKYDIKGNKYNEEANAIKDYMRYDLHVPKGLKPGAWVFEKWRKKTQFAMEDEKALGDMAFKKAHYQYALATRLERAGVDLEALKNVLTRSRNGEVFVSGSKDERLLNTYNKAAEYARNEANRNTYNDINAFASFISQISKRMYDYETEGGKHPLRAGHYLLEGILPFKNTPANIISRATEYSPIGLARTIVLDTGRLIKSVKKGDGKMTGEMFIENIAKGLTGSMLFALGAILAKAGILRGGLGYDDKEDKELRRKGHQSYSLEIGDQSITLDWLAPECIPLFMGVELFNELGNMSAEAWDEKGLKALLNVTTGAYEPMLNMSMLQGVNELFTGFQSSDDLGGLTKVLATVGTSYLTQFQPTLLAQLARSIDPNVRTTYIDKNSKLPPFLQKFWQQSAKKVPGLSYLVPKKIDEMGNEVLQNAGVVGVLEQFLSPAYRKTLTNSPVDQKIAELGVDVYPSAANKYVTYKGVKYNLTASEFEAYATTRGQIAGMLMNALLDDETFKGLSDVDQVKAYKLAYQYGDTVAKSTILGMKGILEDTSPGALESWVGKANQYAERIGSPDALSQFLSTRVALSALSDELGKSNLSRADRAQYLWGAPLPAANKALIMELNDSAGGYAQGTVFYNKNGEVQYDFSEARPETVAEAPAEEIAQVPTATDAPAATAAPSPTPAPTATSDPYSEAVSSVKKMNSAEAFAYLNTTKYSSEEKYQILAQADKNDPKAKAAQSFHSSYGLSYNDMWDVQTKYDSTSFHGYDFQKYVDKKGVKSRQKFALVELANSQSAWLERAEQVNKEMGISYDILWKVKLYWSGESGQGKKARITKYAKGLGLKQSQIDKLYDKYKFLT